MPRLLGIDPGTKRCGVAVSNASMTMAFPREAILFSPTLVADVAALCSEEEVVTIVVGRPLNLSGAATASTSFADTMADSFAAIDGITVVRWDERLTTTQAARNFQEAGLSVKSARSRIDSAAAVVMLQDYLEAQRHD